MEILITASLLAAFIAGIAALFAPCCITVLLPAYLASIFRQKRTIFLMTFIFFLGLLAVFLPLGLGIGGLGQFFSQYHNVLYIAGAAFLLLLGSFLLLGGHFSLPFAPKISGHKVSGAYSIFGLGVFSGFATLCCAPVLAGVLALALLPGSVLLGGLYTLAYVLGMVIPLFFLAYFLDKSDFSKKLWIFKRQISYKIAGRTVSVRMADMISGAVFLFMGIVILYLAQTSQLAMQSSYQTMFNIYTSNATDAITRYLGWIPGEVVIGIILVILAIIIWKTIAYIKRKGR
ncbi:MAG: cytochrome c biogenesis protein CcdA [Candidatus Aenigmatarchaeota archaeon]